MAHVEISRATLTRKSHAVLRQGWRTGEIENVRDIVCHLPVCVVDLKLRRTEQVVAPAQLQLQSVVTRGCRSFEAIDGADGVDGPSVGKTYYSVAASPKPARINRKAGEDSATERASENWYPCDRVK